MEETPHITAVRRQWLLNSIAAGKKTKFIDGKLRRCATEPPAKSLEETVAASRAAAEKAREAERAKIGQSVPGKGIYVGTWTPKDDEGKSLGKIFNVYAAPQDLPDPAGQKSVFRYVQAVKRISELKNWHGHSGTTHATEKELYKALKDGSYKGRLGHSPVCIGNRQGPPEQ